VHRHHQKFSRWDHIDYPRAAKRNVSRFFSGRKFPASDQIDLGDNPVLAGFLQRTILTRTHSDQYNWKYVDSSSVPRLQTAMSCLTAREFTTTPVANLQATRIACCCQEVVDSAIPGGWPVSRVPRDARGRNCEYGGIEIECVHNLNMFSAQKSDQFKNSLTARRLYRELMEIQRWERQETPLRKAKGQNAADKRSECRIGLGRDL